VSVATKTPLRLNIGCGHWLLGPGWQNVDADPNVPAEWHISVPPIPCPDNSVEQIYAGHFLEHLSQEDGRRFLAECYRVLEPGGEMGLVVPHTREIFRRYLAPRPETFEVPEGHFWSTHDLDALNAVFIFSTVQPSHHLWLYDEETLPKAMERAGFTTIMRMDPDDERIAVPSWWDLGFQAVKPKEANRA
jgi:predicted SAM-dependent methyltransferase